MGLSTGEPTRGESSIGYALPTLVRVVQNPCGRHRRASCCLATVFLVCSLVSFVCFLFVPPIIIMIVLGAISFRFLQKLPSFTPMRSTMQEMKFFKKREREQSRPRFKRTYIYQAVTNSIPASTPPSCALLARTTGHPVPLMPQRVHQPPLCRR